MFAVTLITLVIACFVAESTAISCKDVKGVHVNPVKDLDGVEKWILVASMSKYDGHIFVDFDVKNESQLWAHRNNETDPKKPIKNDIVVDFLTHDNLAAYWNKNLKFPLVIKFLFVNKGTGARNFCFYVCRTDDLDKIYVMRCYSNEANAYQNIKQYIIESQIDYTNMTIYNTQLGPGKV